MKLLLYTDSTEPSGMGEHMLALASELARTSRYDLLFACPPAPTCKPFLSRAADLGLRTFSPSNAHDLLSLLSHENPDLLHLHAGIGWEGHDAVYSARRADVPVVVRTEHLPYLLTDPRQQKDYARLVEEVDRIICVSNGARDSFVQAGVPGRKITVVQNGIQPLDATPDRDGLHRELGLPAHALLALTAGRMTEQKGHRYLLHSIPMIASHVPHVCFLWAGVGPLEADLRAEAQSLGLLSTATGAPVHLLFLGRRNDIPRLMASCDLFILPSLFEGLPISALEAMSVGLPVVGTSVIGTNEVLEDGVTGRLVPARQSRALADALIATLTNLNVARSWGRNAARHFRAHFTAPRMSAETEAVYREVMVDGGRWTVDGRR